MIFFPSGYLFSPFCIGTNGHPSHPASTKLWRYLEVGGCRHNVGASVRLPGINRIWKNLRTHTVQDVCQTTAKNRKSHSNAGNAYRWGLYLLTMKETRGSYFVGFPKARLSYSNPTFGSIFPTSIDSKKNKPPFTRVIKKRSRRNFFNN